MSSTHLETEHHPSSSAKANGNGTSTYILGLDWATKLSKCGVACAAYRGGYLHFTKLARADEIAATETDDDLRAFAEIISKSLDEARDSADGLLVAIDAPLGWPKSFKERIVRHRAGDDLRANKDARELSEEMKAFFLRATDRYVHERIDKRPLEVAANLIARTAFSALAFLAELRRAMGSELPVLVDPIDASQDRPLCGVIEVYPAATRSVLESELGWSNSTPCELADEIASLPTVDLPQAGLPWRKYANKTCSNGEHHCKPYADVVDAAICVLAAVDYLEGRCESPAEAREGGYIGDIADVESEGWIWVCNPNTR